LEHTGIGWLIGIYMASNNLKERAANNRHREMIDVMVQSRTPNT